MKIPRAVPDRLQGAGEQSQKSKRQWKVGEWSDDIAAYLPYLTYLTSTYLLLQTDSSPPPPPPLICREEGREKVSMWTRMGTVKFGRSTVS